MQKQAKLPIVIIMLSVLVEILANIVQDRGCGNAFAPFIDRSADCRIITAAFFWLLRVHLMHSSIPSNQTHTERLEARISAEKKTFLKYAAELTGRSLTDFVVNAAYEAATRAIKQHEQVHLSLRDRELFIQALLNAPEPSKVLLSAVKKYKKDVIA